MNNEKTCTSEECCCKCRFQIEVKKCSCGKCPAKIDGYVCLVLSEDLNKPDVGVFSSKHGSCEMFTARSAEGYDGDLEWDEPPEIEWPEMEMVHEAGEWSFINP
jgi:hypothetical protein